MPIDYGAVRESEGIKTYYVVDNVCTNMKYLFV